MKLALAVALVVVVALSLTSSTTAFSDPCRQLCNKVTGLCPSSAWNGSLTIPAKDRFASLHLPLSYVDVAILITISSSPSDLSKCAIVPNQACAYNVWQDVRDPSSENGKALLSDCLSDLGKMPSPQVTLDTGFDVNGTLSFVNLLQPKEPDCNVELSLVLCTLVF